MLASRALSHHAGAGQSIFGAKHAHCYNLWVYQGVHGLFFGHATMR